MTNVDHPAYAEFSSRAMSVTTDVAVMLGVEPNINVREYLLDQLLQAYEKGQKDMIMSLVPKEWLKDNTDVMNAPD